MNDSINSIRLKGRIVSPPVYDHSLFGEAFYKMKVGAKRLSGTEDVLPVTVSERLLPHTAFDAEEGARVDISGQIRSYNQRSDNGNHLIITVFARRFAMADGSEEEYGDVNEAELTGRVCKPVIYRTTPFSREIADILFAVNRRYGKSDYLPVIAWGRNARFAKELLCGDALHIRGRMQSRGYQKALPEGVFEQRTAYEISCSSIERHETLD